MSVVHISEEEAVRDFAEVLSKAAAGVEIVIDHGGSSVRLMGSDMPKARTFAEALALLDKDSPGVMDEDFARDVQNFRDGHPEPLDSSAWD